MNVLSLFDGMSCGQLALQRAGISYDNYYASEVDKFAIKVTQHHFPNTIQLGDVRDVKGSDLPKIDLLLGGSPCQGFSVAGKGLNFDDPRSKLFFEYVRLKEECIPKYFLLENVRMKKEWEMIISKHMGVRPIRLNSSLVSAQLRSRLYWTNIKVRSVPNNKYLRLDDILDNAVAAVPKAYCINTSYANGQKKTLTTKEQGRRRTMVLQINPDKESGGKEPYQQNRIYDTNGKAPALSGELSTGGHKIFQRARGKNAGGLKDVVGSITGSRWEENNLLSDGESIRKLTVNECCRLQTVPDNYFKGIVSNTQAYKMLGNGWTIDIISFLLSFMNLNSLK